MDSTIISKPIGDLRSSRKGNISLSCLSFIILTFAWDDHWSLHPSMIFDSESISMMDGLSQTGNYHVFHLLHPRHSQPWCDFPAPPSRLPPVCRTLISMQHAGKGDSFGWQLGVAGCIDAALFLYHGSSFGGSHFLRLSISVCSSSMASKVYAAFFGDGVARRNRGHHYLLLTFLAGPLPGHAHFLRSGKI